MSCNSEHQTKNRSHSLLKLSLEICTLLKKEKTKLIMAPISKEKKNLSSPVQFDEVEGTPNWRIKSKTTVTQQQSMHFFFIAPNPNKSKLNPLNASANSEGLTGSGRNGSVFGLSRPLPTVMAENNW